LEVAWLAVELSEEPREVEKVEVVDMAGTVGLSGRGGVITGKFRDVAFREGRDSGGGFKRDDWF
jgi:hypothetical protein